MSILEQSPSAGERLVRYCGDVLRIELHVTEDDAYFRAGNAYVRTNFGNADIMRTAVIDEVENGGSGVDGHAWHDIPMCFCGDGHYECTLPLVETGVFEAKCVFFQEGSTEPQWVPGDNLVIKVEPACAVAENTIYNAFVRQFGCYRSQEGRGADQEGAERFLDSHEYTVVPPSGRFRDVYRELPFIMDELGFRIIQLLPVQPPPVTYARMGRYGSPFAPTDYCSVDPALADFDRKATPMDQFQELADGIHSHGGLLILDLPIDHTGWNSTLQVLHPEWFCHDEDGKFTNPGAWGVVWEDLCKLDFSHRELWIYLADVFLFWTRHGVDGFRCDAGYMVPQDAWKYITAKVRDQFPDTLFFLEGLGGSPEVTRSLLQSGGMDWAYSELFQQFGADAIRGYLAHSFNVSDHDGLAVNYAETHDNDRLAAKGAKWAKMRTVLAALTSPRGAFGIANGVEWLATEKIDVHGASSLNWGAELNLIDHISRLNDILRNHPAFGAGSSCRLVGNGTAIGVLRMAADEKNNLLVVLNVEENASAWLEVDKCDFPLAPDELNDLLSPDARPRFFSAGDGLRVELGAGEAVCLESKFRKEDYFNGLSPVEVQELRESILSTALAVRDDKHDVMFDWNLKIDTDKELQGYSEDPRGFVRKLEKKDYAPVVEWAPERDERRVVTIPPRHFLLVNSLSRFRLSIVDGERTLMVRKSVRRADGGYFVLLYLPFDDSADGKIRTLTIRHEAFPEGKAAVVRTGKALFPQYGKTVLSLRLPVHGDDETVKPDTLGLCTNRGGGYTLARGAWGRLESKYDALLAANLDSNCPTDRIVALTRLRAWIVCKGYSIALDETCQVDFQASYENILRWSFKPVLYGGCHVSVEVTFKLNHEGNGGMVEFRVHDAVSEPLYSEIPDDPLGLELIVRPDVDWRVNHEVTKACNGAETEFRKAVTAIVGTGFRFAPWGVAGLSMKASKGRFAFESEWHYSVHLPEDAARALPSETDVFSPGYFHADLLDNDSLCISFGIGQNIPEPEPQGDVSLPEELPLKECLKRSLAMYVADRDDVKTVIAGYPWFLDWGRDTLICLRGMIAAGMVEEAEGIIRAMASFEQDGTIPNMIRGKDGSDRATSDAPLWLFVAVDELSQAMDSNQWLVKKDCCGRSLLDVLVSIAEHYHSSLPNGIHCDSRSGLVFSPSHFTWMDTNYPAGTPRQGYPVEIQVLWIKALSILEELSGKSIYRKWAKQATDSFLRLFVRKDGRGLYDCLHGEPGQGADECVPDDTVRPNQLFAVTLLEVLPENVATAVVDACTPLLIPGGIRSLDDADVAVEQPVWSGDGRLLNNPRHPYIGRYEGDEDTRRKPAYHNGTAWGWMMPMYCEALVEVYGTLVVAWRLLATAAVSMRRGCLGHIPEIYDGDAPHAGRGCPAQAWSMAEACRVLLKIDDISSTIY